jgi:hypothetical protein
MSISKYVKSLQKHLAQFGLYPVPDETVGEEPAIFKIRFLNLAEMQRWNALQKQEGEQKEIIPLIRDVN